MKSDPRKQQHEFDKLQKRLRRQLISALDDYRMIEPGDKVMVCISGGKDSFALLDLLWMLHQQQERSLELIAVNLDQKQPGFPAEVLPRYLSERQIPFHILEQDTYSVVKQKIPEGKTTCSLCSRLRRGALYRLADQLGATKIALGHHRDDLLATFFLNLFYGGKLKAMPAKLLSDDQRHLLIRPLVYCREADLIEYAQYRQFPIIPCNLCGSQENLQRKAIEQMLLGWEQQHPGRTETLFRALQNTVPEHLADLALFDFKALTADRQRIATWHPEHEEPLV